MRASVRMYRIMTGKLPPTPLITIIGATGTGKSRLAVSLARRLNGEIINGDAMQLYSGLPIITNKIADDECKGVPHHLLGCVGLHESTWTVKAFRQRALGVMHEIRSRGKVPVLVGGTHYYVQGLLFEGGLLSEEDEGAEGKQKDVLDDSNLDEQRRNSQWPVLEGPTDDMLRMLREVDPVMAERWHPNDRRKIRRSLEIWLQTGKRASEIYREQQQSRKGDALQAAGGFFEGQRPEMGAAQDLACLDDSRQAFRPLIIWIYAESELLKMRLDARVDDMLQHGLLSEVEEMEQFLREQELSGRAVDRTTGIWVSIGFKEFEKYIEALRSGCTDLKTLEALKQSAVEQTKAATRQYGKRQVRWIRIKFLGAVRDAGMSGNMFTLDGSNLSRWDEDVEQPAIRIAEAYLDGQELPDPRSVSGVPIEILAPPPDLGVADSEHMWFKKTCDICTTTVTREEDWAKHITSRRHRRAVKSHDMKCQHGEKIKSSDVPVFEPVDVKI